MSFGEIQFLYALALIPVVALFLAWTAQRQRSALSRLGDRALLNQLSQSVHRRGRILRNLLWLLALALVVLALARPQWGSAIQVVERQGVQIMLALDISESMLAQDAAPSRLDRAKLEIIDLLSRLDGDEVALVLFSGASFVQFPLTFDYATAQTFLDNANPGIISRGGTAIEDAINTALAGFDFEQPGQKVIIIMSDGENQEGDPAMAARRAAQQDVVIYTVGLGSTQGQPIPVFDAQGELVDYKRDEQGQVVQTSLDEAMLQGIAREGRGQYFRASDGSLTQALLTELDSLEKARIEREIERRPLEQFQWFLGAALLALVAAELIPDRITKREPAQGAPEAA